MALKSYILEKPYFDSKAARFYKAGDKIALDPKDPAVALCVDPSAPVRLPDEEDDQQEAEVTEKPAVAAPPVKGRKSATSLMG